MANKVRLDDYADTAACAPEVMTLPEVAAYLRLAEKTVLRMVHKGQTKRTTFLLGVSMKDRNALIE